MAITGMGIHFGESRRFEVEDKNGKTNIFVKGYSDKPAILRELSDDEVSAIGQLINEYLKCKQLI